MCPGLTLHRTVHTLSDRCVMSALVVGAFPNLHPQRTTRGERRWQASNQDPYNASPSPESPWSSRGTHKREPPNPMVPPVAHGAPNVVLTGASFPQGGLHGIVWDPPVGLPIAVLKVGGVQGG